MKKIIPILITVLIFLTVGFYNYFFISSYPTDIYYIQTVPPESLAIGHDRSLRVGDTVTVIGRVVAPPRVNPSGGDFRKLLRGTNSHQAYIQDTLNNVWGGIIVRQGDSTSNTGFDQVDSGMKIRVTGIVQEFPDIISSGATQIGLDVTQFVNTLPTIKRRPTPILVNVTDFDSLGYIKFRTGEKYEGMYVELRNLIIGPQSSNTQRHIRRLLDANGNFIYLRDFSNFFSVAPSPSWGWTPWVPPSIGASVNYIRGVIINAGVAEPPQGIFPYVIVPIYPNDLSLGNTPPFIANVSRVPCIPKPPDSVQVNATVTDTLDNPISVDSVQLFYRINRGTYIRKHMNNTGNIYFTKMPPQTNGTLVEYFVRAKDNLGAIRLSPSDTSRSTYFYRVRLSDTMSIYDVQWTANNGGFSAYNNCDVITEGIVTADTSDIPPFQFQSSGGTQSSPRRVIIQDGNVSGGWSGIWINGNPTDPLVKGQRVRVRGTVEESNSVTRINIATPNDITIISNGNPLPPFENLTPGVIANTKADGDTTAERWESILIRFNEPVSISCIVASSGTACSNTLPLPDSSFRRNFGEIFVLKPGENIEARVELQDGSHNFTNGWDSSRANWYNPNLPGILLYQWNGFTTLQGVLYYAFGRYKLVPRKDNDFGSVIGIQNLNESPSVFWLRQNYPNPFNPYTNIVYNIPTESEVTLKVYNLLGQEVRTLVNGIQNRGKYSIRFDGSNLASGLYFYVLESISFEGEKSIDVKKMVLVK
ncbi:MAG: T9SS type A sorting domain-containing protein [Ignavibacteria bacterium]